MSQIKHLGLKRTEKFSVVVLVILLQIPFGLLPVDKEYNAEAPGLLSLVRLFHQPISFLDAGHDAITRGLVSAPADKVNERFTTSETL